MRALRSAVVLVAMAAVVIGPASRGLAQDSSAGGWPDGLWAPLDVAPDAPPPLQVRSLSVRTDDSGASRAEVRLAGAIAAPTERWRISVGIGDPAGVWRRASMVWDGAQAQGELVQLNGLATVDQGALEASVDLSGLVTIGLPSDYLLPASGDVVWVEAALGPDDRPAASVRTPWFDRAALLGEGAPGLVPGGRNGVRLAGSPPQPATTSTGPVDTGVPSVAEWVDGRVVIERGVAPEQIEGAAISSIVDYVTIVSAESPGTSGAQVRLDLGSGEVGLTDGVLTGPLSASPVEPRTPLGASTAWLAQPGGLLSVGVTATFAQLGLPDPGSAVVVSVTRKVVTATGEQVASGGVAAGQNWLSQRQAPATTGAVAAGGAATSSNAATGDPVPAILIGIAVGVVAVGGSVLLADRRARRNRPGPADVDHVVAGQPDEEFWSR